MGRTEDTDGAGANASFPFGVMGNGGSLASVIASLAPSFSNQESMPLAFENHARQSTCHIGTCINVDAIGQDLGCVGGGMAVNDPLPKIDCAVEKLVANPQ